MKHKSLYVLLLMLYVSVCFTENCYGQLTVDVGNDINYCTDLNTSSVPMDLKINITNGVAPYTYAWQCLVVPYGILKPLSASDILNDSTLVSPTIIGSIWLFTQKKVKFILTITDQAGNHAKDSMNVDFSTCSCTTGYQVIELNKGDSVWLNAGNPQGSVASYYWEPSIGLSKPNSSATWCKPDVTTNYSIVKVDSLGCTCSCHAYEIKIIPTNSEYIKSYPNSNINLFQKGSSVFFNNIMNHEVSISIFTMEGKLLHRGNTIRDNFEVSQILRKKGTYIVKITVDGNTGICKFLKL